MEPQTPDAIPSRPPQGIEIAFRSTGDSRKDFHPRFRNVPCIDPASLVVDGQDPYLALPIEGDHNRIRVRQILAEHAAELLTCDPASGGPSRFRLATDAEVAAHFEEAAARGVREQANRDELARKQAERYHADQEAKRLSYEKTRAVFIPKP